LQVLEGQLGVALIIRDKQRLRLTPAAQDYVAEVRKALQGIASASLTLRANPDRRQPEPGDPARLRHALAGPATGPLCPGQHAR
jgi:DNA-binding transcriptional LysR family regulator